MAGDLHSRESDVAIFWGYRGSIPTSCNKDIFVWECISGELLGYHDRVEFIDGDIDNIDNLRFRWNR